MGRAARGVHERAGRERVGVPVDAAQAVQHQLGAVVELQAEPVPARLLGRQLVGEELVVHPREPLDLEPLPLDLEGARGDQARERDVVRRAAGPRGLLAHAVDAVDDGGFRRAQREARGEGRRHRLQLLMVAVPVHLPVAVPDAPRLEAGAGKSRARAVHALVVEEAAPLQVAEREVGEVDVADLPRRRRGRQAFRAAVGDRLPEERQLEAEGPAVAGPQVPRVVPPLGAELGVAEVVAGEFEAVAGQRQPVAPLLAARPEGGEQHAPGDGAERDASNSSAPSAPPTPHARPRSGRGASRPAPGRGRRARWPRRRRSGPRSAGPRASGSGSSTRTTAC